MNPPSQPSRTEIPSSLDSTGRPGRRQSCGSVPAEEAETVLHASGRRRRPGRSRPSAAWRAVSAGRVAGARGRAEGGRARPPHALGRRCRPGRSRRLAPGVRPPPPQRPEEQGMRGAMAAVAAPTDDSAARRVGDCRHQPGVGTGNDRGQPTSAGSRLSDRRWHCLCRMGRRGRDTCPASHPMTTPRSRASPTQRTYGTQATQWPGRCAARVASLAGGHGQPRASRGPRQRAPVGRGVVGSGSVARRRTSALVTCPATCAAWPRQAGSACQTGA